MGVDHQIKQTKGLDFWKANPRLYADDLNIYSNRLKKDNLKGEILLIKKIKREITFWIKLEKAKWEIVGV